MTTELKNPKAHIEKGYDLIADKYLAWSNKPRKNPRMSYISELITKVPAGASILELGCGAGVPATQTLISHGFKVTGNDISASQIALARKHIPSATLIQGDMLALSFPENTFDAVLGFYSIIHLPNDEQGLMVEKIKSWLKPGGWFLANFALEDHNIVRKGWLEPEVTMFWGGNGVEGTRDIFRKHVPGFKVVVDEVTDELVDNEEERFHWIMAQKE